jgi:hypothetical protein
MKVSHDVLVEIQTWKKNNMSTRRDHSSYFYNDLEFGVKRRNVRN